jgi:hypothetical protein
MAVKDFIPSSGAKNTIEKIVAEKPRTEDLIKVEVPGKPSPASMLEQDNSKYSFHYEFMPETIIFLAIS